jgi:hypothetical protein
MIDGQGGDPVDARLVSDDPPTSKMLAASGCSFARAIFQGRAKSESQIESKLKSRSLAVWAQEIVGLSLTGCSGASLLFRSIVGHEVDLQVPWEPTRRFSESQDRSALRSAQPCDHRGELATFRWRALPASFARWEVSDESPEGRDCCAGVCGADFSQTV